MGLTFFGLTSEHKAEIHKSIFSLIYYGSGGFTFDDVYAMPIYLRNFYIKQLEDVKLKEAEAAKEQAKSLRKR